MSAATRHPLDVIEDLVEACERAFAGPSMAQFADDEDVSHPPTGITFGMIRRARAVLEAAQAVGGRRSVVSSRPSDAALRCAYTTAADVRCRRDAGHDGAHDTTYMFESEHDHFVALAMLHAGIDRSTAEAWQASAERIDKALPDWTDDDWKLIERLAYGE